MRAAEKENAEYERKRAAVDEVRVCVCVHTCFEIC
jgi:hypothetical protein